MMQWILKNVEMKFQKLGSVTFKNLMEWDKCYSILLLHTQHCVALKIINGEINSLIYKVEEENKKRRKIKNHWTRQYSY